MVSSRDVITKGGDSSDYERVLLKTKSAVVRASASGAVAGTSAATGTVVRTAAANVVAGMPTGTAVKASGPGGTDVICARR